MEFFTNCQNVINLSGVRIGANLYLEIEHLDVKIAFLHGDLQKEIYMEELEGFNRRGQEEVCMKIEEKYV